MNKKRVKQRFFYNTRFDDPRYVVWRRAVLKRDNHSCQVCGDRHYLHAHHIKPWSTNEELRYEVDNGLTCCSSCHMNIHPWMKKFYQKRRKYTFEQSEKVRKLAFTATDTVLKKFEEDKIAEAKRILKILKKGDVVQYVFKVNTILNKRTGSTRNLRRKAWSYLVEMREVIQVNNMCAHVGRIAALPKESRARLIPSFIMKKWGMISKEYKRVILRKRR